MARHGPQARDRQFWTAASNLRSRLREWDDLESKILHREGEIYRIDPDIVSTDLWIFQHALHDAAQSSDNTAKAEALRRAVDVYQGEFAKTAGWIWLGPAR